MGRTGSYVIALLERLLGSVGRGKRYDWHAELKHLYVYGSLDRAPTTLVRTFELTTTFASHYTARVGLEQLLDIETLRRCAQMATGEKFLITPAHA